MIGERCQAAVEDHWLHFCGGKDRVGGNNERDRGVPVPLTISVLFLSGRHMTNPVALSAAAQLNFYFSIFIFSIAFPYVSITCHCARVDLSPALTSSNINLASACMCIILRSTNYR
jgi:hypothetical protein